MPKGELDKWLEKEEIGEREEDESGEGRERGSQEGDGERRVENGFCTAILDHIDLLRR